MSDCLIPYGYKIVQPFMGFLQQKSEGLEYK